MTPEQRSSLKNDGNFVIIVKIGEGLTDFKSQNKLFCNPTSASCLASKMG